MSVTQVSLLGLSWLLAAPSVLWAADAPLADAAEKMDRTRVHSLLEQSVDVNATQVDGMTALHWVTLHDDLETARRLVEAGAEVAAANRYGVTSLTLACTNGNGPLVELLLAAGADPNTTLPGGETALMTASRTGRLGPVEALLARGADVHATVQGMGRQDGAGATKFLARMADPTIFDFKAKTEQTALVWAAAEGHADVVAVLIQADAEFEMTLESGFTPLLFAVRQGHADVVRSLVTAGADVNQVIEPVREWQHPGYEAFLKPGTAPLHVAVENGHFELATYLLDVGADPDAADPTGYTALHAIAATRRVPLGDANPPPEGSGRMTSLDFVREMAARGANLNARMRIGLPPGGDPNGPGTTPFLLAAQTADVELIKTFAELGADPLVRNQDNATPLMLAGRRTGTEEDVVQTMETLLEMGVDINAVDWNSETAMHMAAYRDRGDAIRLLASKGADIDVWNQENGEGSTPLAIAVGYRRGTFRPNPEAEAAVREVMLAQGITPPEKVTPHANALGAQTCDADGDGDVRFVCGTTNPEDLYQVLDTPWVIASGRVSDVAGPIYAVHVGDHRVQEIFPQGALSPEHDTVTYGGCPGPNPVFQPHGLTLREGRAGRHTLYVVGHGAREAIEVFDLDVRGEVPSLKWIGCIVSPEGTARINSITALPNNTIGVTNFDRDGGELWEWQPDTGWTEVPGSQMPGPNGLVSSADGQWFYIGGWSGQALVRLSRGQTPIQIDAAPVGFNVDNVRWGTDGNIVVAGHVTSCEDFSDCELSVARVAKVDPVTLQVQQLVDYKGNEFFRVGTVAIEVDKEIDEIWVGGIRGTFGIARFPQ